MAPPVVVVGSGAAGLAAALAAAHAGADVLVLEAADAIGGTTAISGGVVWAPGNAFDDSDPADAHTYVQAVAHGDVDRAALDTFVDDAGRVMAAIEDRTPLRWAPLPGWPDYHSEFPGGSDGGRSVWPTPMTLPAAVAERVQHAPDSRGRPATDADGAITDAMVFRGPVRGQALVGGLLAGLIVAGAEIRTGARVHRLHRSDSGIDGVQLAGERIEGRVILTTGGFQHDPVLRSTFLAAPGVVPLGTPDCNGAGLRMAMAAGSGLGNMTEGWWMPALTIPGEQLNDKAYSRPLHSERAQPGSILVDRHGERFVDEAQNYCDVGRAMQRFDAGSYSYPASPCWMVFDAGYRSRYPVGPLDPAEPGDREPEWLFRADDLTGLAEQLQIPSAALAATVDRFNAGAVKGEDLDFGRGSRPYDRWIGDPRAPHPTLAPLVDGPFFAIRVDLGCMGTKGGPRTDDRGRVLDIGGRTLPGLYAAGNAAASAFGIGVAAGGGTIGPALVFGDRAGGAAAGDGGSA
ncbi:MAG: Fumarate reductase flavoprotein subunit [Actinomycetia bacterium]|nr:Fumarate reductase flavoprotein subunit [Actinomycetes bacterium]